VDIALHYSITVSAVVNSDGGIVRFFDLNGETKTARTKHSSTIIVRRR
jgi:hypothetical protein